MTVVMDVGDSGVTMPVGVEWFPAGTRLRMLRDRCLVRVLPWQPSRIVKVESDIKPVRGVVAAIGPGAYRKRYYLNERREPYKVGEIPGRVWSDVKVGDTVEVGGLELRGYSFPEVMIGDERHILCQEADICVVDEDPIENYVMFEDVRAETTAMVAHDRNMERKTVHKPSEKFRKSDCGTRPRNW